MSLHTCTYQYFGIYMKKTHCRSPEFFVQLCPDDILPCKPQVIWSSIPQVIGPQLRESTGLHLGSSFMHHSLEILSKQSAGAFVSHHSQISVLHYLMPSVYKLLCDLFCFVLGCFHGKLNPVPVYPILVPNRSLNYSVQHTV